MPETVQGESGKFLKRAGLAIAAVLIVVLLVTLRAYRWFFLISGGIGVLVACVLFLWHRLRPVKEPEFNSKRPLGLS